MIIKNEIENIYNLKIMYHNFNIYIDDSDIVMIRNDKLREKIRNLKEKEIQKNLNLHSKKMDFENFSEKFFYKMNYLKERLFLT